MNGGVSRIGWQIDFQHKASSQDAIETNGEHMSDHFDTLADDRESARIEHESMLQHLVEDMQRIDADDWDKHLTTFHVRGLVRQSIIRYIRNGSPGGHFLNAVLKNDLKEACNRADDDNRGQIYEIVKFLYNRVPQVIWGGETKFQDWIRAHQLWRAGQEAKRLRDVR